MTTDFEPAQTPDADTLGTAAARGVGVLVGRTLGLQLLTAGVTIALARLLTPSDYGIFAVALAVQLVGQRAAELGLPAALVRMEDDPSPELQAAVSGLMLALSIVIAAIALLLGFAVAPLLGGGETLRVVAIAVLAMPLYAARATPMALLEREMRFGAVAVVETVDTLIFNFFALIAAIAGLGAYSLVGAVPAGGLAAAVAAYAIRRPPGRPRLDLALVRPLTGFGARVTVLQGVYVVKDLGFVALVAAIGGTAVAGFYAMAKRLFSFPTALTFAVGRVSLPALSRSRDNRARNAARMTGLTATAAGLPLALVAGPAQPLISVLLGDEWLPATDIVLWGSIGMIFSASALATMISFALAENRPNDAIAAGAVETATLFVLTAALTGTLDETGVGIALAVSAVSSAAVMALLMPRRLRRSLVVVTRATLVAAGATAAAQLANLGNDVTGLAAGAVIVTGTWLALSAIFARGDLIEAVSAARPLVARLRSA